MNLNDKDHLVDELAIRWWYALPRDWIPNNYDFVEILKQRGFRIVDNLRWKLEPEED